MGALTDTRKRCLVDQHRLPIPLSDEATPPPFKKPKLFPSPPPFLPPPPPPPLPPSQNPSPPASPATPMPHRRYPPPAPFRRPVHAPQLNIRVLGLGSSATRSPRNLNSHGSPFSQFRFAGEERPAAPDTNVNLGLEEYKRLVVEQEEHAQLAEAESPAVEAEAETTPVSELTVVSRDPGEESDLYILDRKVDDGGKVVMESTPVRQEPVSTRRSTPFYKELYENLSREHDSKLSSIAFEAKLLEKKRWSFCSVREALSLAKPKPKEDPRGPFTPLTDEEEAAVNHALRGGIRNEVLVVHKASNIEITREVMRCLSDCAWLNDEVINVYLELLKERETREPKRFLKCHFFNSFFYKKLISGKKCTSWRQLARDPQLWCCIDMRLNSNSLDDCVMEKLTFEAIDRGNGYIEEFYAGGFIWDDTFTYIANRTTGLRSLALIKPRGFTEKAFIEFICRCPLLEEIEITDYLVYQDAYEKIELACPKLKRFQLTTESCPIRKTWNSNFHVDYQEDEDLFRRRLNMDRDIEWNYVFFQDLYRRCLNKDGDIDWNHVLLKDLYTRCLKMDRDIE